MKREDSTTQPIDLGAARAMTQGTGAPPIDEVQGFLVNGLSKD
jgi:hypothetical protein